jgi:lipopolysaccharide biosynthesis protein
LVSDARNPRLVAFYLPQFHPTPENDAWWGKGFTEWTNTAKAVPLFTTHYQPHQPSDLGYYDLRVRETRHEQMVLARQYGIDAFCYHYYWFSGRRLLCRPLDDMLADPASDLPFCLCWANEHWTRRWDAAENQILIEQLYRPEDDRNFIADLVPFLRDARYVRIDGAPLVIVYRPQQLPDAARSLRIWRDYCRESGLGEIHLCAALTHGNRRYAEWGFDSAVEFPPHCLDATQSVNDEVDFLRPFQGNVVPYESIGRMFLDRRYQEPNVFRTVFPSWDNTARTGARAFVALNGTPGNYEYWLAESLRRTRADFPGRERLVFVNAWNEWAEGCHLEPDRRYGRGFLEATARAADGTSALTDFPDRQRPPRSQVHRRRLGRDLAEVVSYHMGRLLGRVRLRINQFPRVKAIIARGLQLIRR